MVGGSSPTSGWCAKGPAANQCQAVERTQGASGESHLRGSPINQETSPPVGQAVVEHAEQPVELQAVARRHPWPQREHARRDLQPGRDETGVVLIKTAITYQI